MLHHRAVRNCDGVRVPRGLSFRITLLSNEVLGGCTDDMISLFVTVMTGFGSSSPTDQALTM